MTTARLGPILTPGGRGTGRGGSAHFLGRATRDYLLEHGSASPTEIHQYITERLALATTARGFPWRNSTWISYWHWFRMAIRLDLVEKVAERPRLIPSETSFLVPETFYRLTVRGRQQEKLWQDVRSALYPVDPQTRKEYSAAARQRKAQRRQQLIEITGRAPPPRPPRARRAAEPTAPEAPEISTPLPEAPEAGESPMGRRVRRARERLAAERLAAETQPEQGENLL